VPNNFQLILFKKLPCSLKQVESDFIVEVMFVLFTENDKPFGQERTVEQLEPKNQSRFYFFY